MPSSSAERFVGALTVAAPLVAFLAAVPGQGGDGHLNEQWPAYWAALFAKRGYEVVDCLRELFWDDARVQWWYAQNALLFVDTAALDAITALRSHPRRGRPRAPPPGRAPIPSRSPTRQTTQPDRPSWLALYATIARRGPCS
jgi:hypothetical protein